MMRMLIALSFLLLGPVGVSAQNGNIRQDGNFYLPFCKQVTNGQLVFIGGVCMGSVSATAYVARLLPKNMKACPPDGVTGEQLVRVVVQYMQTNPALLHNDFEMLVLGALRKAWPCP